MRLRPARAAPRTPSGVGTGPVGGTRSTTTSLIPAVQDRQSGVVDITVTSSIAGGAAPAEGSGFRDRHERRHRDDQHVVAGATSIKVRFRDGTVEKATLVGTDPSPTIAVIRSPAIPRCSIR